jgi:hypothetical protein
MFMIKAANQTFIDDCENAACSDKTIEHFAFFAPLRLCVKLKP